MNANITSQRALFIGGVALLTLFSVGWIFLMGTFPPPRADLSADAVAHIYADHNLRFRIGVCVCLISGAWMMPWSLVISVQMARLEKGIPIWAILQSLTALITSMLFWAPALLWGAAAFSPERDPALTLILHEAAWLTYITPLCVFPMQNLAIAVVAFTKSEPDAISAFPRWLGYLSAWQFVQCLGGVMAQLFKSGIFAWGGLIPFWLPTVAFVAWICAINFTVLRALRDQEKAETRHALGALA